MGGEDIVGVFEIANQSPNTGFDCSTPVLGSAFARLKII